MPRIQWRLVLALLFTISLLTLLMGSVAVATSAAQESTQAQADGQEYVVQAGDWLSTISLEFLGSVSAFPQIIDATNAKAKSDPSFTPITNPNLIQVGQKLWIPIDSPAAAVEMSPSATVTDAMASEIMTNDEMSPTVVVTGAMAAGLVDDGEIISPSVRFVTPQDGAVVTPSLAVEMAARGITIEPAGEIQGGAGHFHILVDTDFVAPGELIPFDDQHLHFGQGQLTTTLELEPGIHTLRLQLANGAHIALGGKEYRDIITVTVSTEEIVLPSVSFVTPLDGAVVTPSLAVEMAAEGIAIEPAGEIHEGVGHFHILVDTDFVAPGELIPFDDQHLHFGMGQLTTTLELDPGIHTLRLQLANGAHIALEGEEYQDTITVTVTTP